MLLSQDHRVRTIVLWGPFKIITKNELDGIIRAEGGETNCHGCQNLVVQSNLLVHCSHLVGKYCTYLIHGPASLQICLWLVKNIS
jgi:hypothetical protein